jgi:hypothetical protein
MPSTAAVSLVESPRARQGSTWHSRSVSCASVVLPAHLAQSPKRDPILRWRALAERLTDSARMRLRAIRMVETRSVLSKQLRAPARRARRTPARSGSANTSTIRVVGDRLDMVRIISVTPTCTPASRSRKNKRGVATFKYRSPASSVVVRPTTRAPSSSSRRASASPNSGKPSTMMTEGFRLVSGHTGRAERATLNSTNKDNRERRSQYPSTRLSLVVGPAVRSLLTEPGGRRNHVGRRSPGKDAVDTPIPRRLNPHVA